MLRKLRQKFLTPAIMQIASLERKVDDIDRKMTSIERQDDDLDSKITSIERKIDDMHHIITSSAAVSEHKRKYGVTLCDAPLTSPLVSSLAQRRDILSLSRWANELNNGISSHRKLWEFEYISQTLFEKGMLEPKKKGLGFAVGSEALPALFAKYGVKVTASDLDESNPQSLNWQTHNAHAASIEHLERLDICDKDTFYENVSFIPLDMNNIPDNINDFDFCWSSCAFEHLGTVEKGRQFIHNTLKLLKPGGISVHTTEYNISSEESFDDVPYQAIYGKNFFDKLQEEITAAGHSFSPLDLRLGNHPDDDYVAPAGKHDVHMKLMLSGNVSTSIGIIITKGSN